MIKLEILKDLEHTGHPCKSITRNYVVRNKSL